MGNVAKSAGWTVARHVAPGFAARWEVLRYVEQTLTPAPAGAGRPAAFGGLRPVRGVDLRVEEQVARVEQWSAHAELFRMLRDDPRINTWHLGQARIHNGFYATPDAEAYAAMITDLRPSRIVEVGGGFSTHIARTAIDLAGLPCRLTVIDPQPRTDVAAVADEVVRARVEDGALGTVEPGTILFIDSSHVLRIGGDVPYLYGQVIPGLPVGVTVHVHDIYTPYDYPPSAAEYFWNEQYVVEALLSGAPRYQVLLATHYLGRTQRPLLQRVIGQAAGEAPHHPGGALWFRVAQP